MAKDKKDFLILSLIIVVVLLLGLVAYVFLITPAMNGLVVKGYYQGVNDIVSQVKTNGYVQIPTGENQTLILVPYQPAETTSK